MDRITYRRVVNAGAIILGLSGIIAVHVMDLPGKLSEVPYLGLMYIGVISAAGALIQRMMSGPSRRDYLASAALAGAVFVGYVINRTVGMPGATDDIGNWFEPLGLLSLVIEAWVVGISLAGARLAVRRVPASPSPARVKVDTLAS